MRDRILAGFDQVRADDDLLQRTAAFLATGPVALGQGAKKRRPYRAAAVWVTMLAVVTLGLFSRWYYLTPDAYVSIDVNPSMELAFSRAGRVVSTYAFNADGERVLGVASLKGKTYDQAVEAVVSRLDAGGYLEGQPVSVTVQAGSQQERLLTTLEAVVSDSLASHGSHGDVAVLPITADVRATAHQCHMSPAKYLAIQELLEVDEAATLEAYRDSTIRQIQERVRECRGHSQAQEQNGGRGNRRGGHHGGR